MPHQVQNPAFLTPEQQRDLFRRHQAGDRAAGERLLLAFQPLVGSIAASFSSSLPYEDRFQEGNLGLLDAVERFNPAKGSLGIYAPFWIRRRIRTACRIHARADKVNWERIRIAMSEISARAGGRLVTLDQVQEATGINYTEVNRLALENLPDNSPSPAVVVEQRDQQALLRTMLAKLSAEEQTLLKLRFRMAEGHTSEAAEDLTFTQIGQQVGLKKLTTRKRFYRALAKLRHLMKGAQ